MLGFAIISLLLLALIFRVWTLEVEVKDSGDIVVQLAEIVSATCRVKQHEIQELTEHLDRETLSNGQTRNELQALVMYMKKLVDGEGGQ